MRARAARLGALLLAVCTTYAASTFAQEWPQRPIRIVVPFGPGSADTAARIIAEGLKQRFGKVVVVDNRPGAGQNVGAAVLSRAAPDGYTIMVTAPGPLVINQFIYSKLDFDPHAFSPILLLTTDPLVFVVNSKSRFSTLKAFLEEAKAHPGKFTFGSAGAGATSHMMSAVLFSMAGVDVTHVPYKGGSESATALLGGHVDFLASSPVSAVPQIQSGAFRALAVSAAAGAPILPAVAPVAVSGVPGYDYATWLAVVAPPRLAPALANRISAAIEEIFRSEDLRKKLAAFGSKYEGGGPKRLADWIEKERSKWKLAVEASGAKAQ